MDFLETLKNPGVIWFIVGVILALLEFAAPGLILIFFAIGAWITAGAYFMTHVGISGQLGIFIIVSLIALLGLRKNIKHKLFESKDEERDDTELIGSQALVTEKVQGGLKAGKVKLRGTDWKAVADDPIDIDATVEVVGMNGLTLTVKKMES